MKFRVRGTAHQKVRIPFQLGTSDRLHVPRRVAMTWTFGISKDHHGSFWSINGKRFDPSRVDHRVALGSVERWKLRNTSDTTHYVHLHEELWRTLQRDGKRPPPWERGYEDTWRLDPGESVVVAARFTDYTGRLHAPLPHARPRGRRHDGDVPRRQERDERSKPASRAELERRSTRRGRLDQTNADDARSRAGRRASRGRRRARPPCASGAAASRAGCGRGSSRCSR